MDRIPNITTAMYAATIDAVFVSVNAPIFLNSTIIAPVMAGIANKNANLAAHTLSTPENKPADIEEPDLEIPGNNARDSNMPMNRAFLKEIPFIFLFPSFHVFSAPEYDTIYY